MQQYYFHRLMIVVFSVPVGSDYLCNVHVFDLSHSSCHVVQLSQSPLVWKRTVMSCHLSIIRAVVCSCGCSCSYSWQILNLHHCVCV